MKSPIATILLSLAICLNASCVDEPTEPSKQAVKEKKASEEKKPASKDAKLETATLGAGCYWCVEAVLERTDGIKTVVSGFMGGEIDNPTYEAVVSGTTGHAEVVQLKFDPSVISYDKIVDLFWELHDPTTLNRQGADVGTQYRSAIFYHSDEQKKAAQASKKAHAKDFDDPIVTEISAASKFYPAKLGHQNFLTDNPYHGYSRAVIWPKLKKLGLEKNEPSEK
ncbi:MAG: peptide-methionine (S)-S-oxide reductase MsrA [Verrucomicrobiales bacterium]